VEAERTLFDLFMLSPLDDITHSVTALAYAAAALHSGRLVRFVFVTFGSYYARNAIFFLLYGFVNDKGPVANPMLNLPHVVIGAWMLGLVYRSRGIDGVLQPQTARA